MIAPNNYVSMSTGSAQEQWLKADLAATSKPCIAAYWHEPRFTSGSEHGNNTATGPLWDDLYAAHADLVLNGHNHQYERFALQNPSEVADPNSIREFVVGTGGAGLCPFGTVKPNSQVQTGSSRGVAQLPSREKDDGKRLRRPGCPTAGVGLPRARPGRCCRHPKRGIAG